MALQVDATPVGSLHRLLLLLLQLLVVVVARQHLLLLQVKFACRLETLLLLFSQGTTQKTMLT